MPLKREHVLCPLDELPEGGSRGFDLEGRGRPSIFAVRLHGAVHVYAESCPHQGTPMAWRQDAYLNATGDRIVCAAHGAQFEVDTGLCVLGPCLGDRLQSVTWRLAERELIVLADQVNVRGPTSSTPTREIQP